MRTMTFFWSVLILLATSPVLVLAEEVVFVPNAVSKQASFKEVAPLAVNDNGAAAAESKAREFSSDESDGGAVVIGGSVLVTSLQDAHFSLEKKDAKNAEPIIVLRKGEFLVHVGSKPATFKFGEATLQVQGAAMTVAETVGGHVVLLDSLFDKGRATLIVTVESSPPPASKLGLALPVQKRIEVETGRALLVSQGREPFPARESDIERLKKLKARLEEQSENGPFLKATDVEQPSDLLAQNARDGNDFENIEVDDVEVEAGCIEVCLD